MCIIKASIDDVYQGCVIRLATPDAPKCTENVVSLRERPVMYGG